MREYNETMLDWEFQNQSHCGATLFYLRSLWSFGKAYLYDYTLQSVMCNHISTLYRKTIN